MKSHRVDTWGCRAILFLVSPLLDFLESTQPTDHFEEGSAVNLQPETWVCANL